jgi:hypothetical protein
MWDVGNILGRSWSALLSDSLPTISRLHPINLLRCVTRRIIQILLQLTGKCL